ALRLNFVLIFIVIVISTSLIFTRLIKRLQVRTNQHEEQKNSRENFHGAPCKIRNVEKTDSDFFQQRENIVHRRDPVPGVGLTEYNAAATIHYEHSPFARS